MVFELFLLITEHLAVSICDEIRLKEENTEYGDLERFSLGA